MNLINDNIYHNQQPVWYDKTILAKIRTELCGLPPLIDYEEIVQLYKQLEHVYSGKAIIFQAGDCAERISESSPIYVYPKLNFLCKISDQFSQLMKSPVITIGRIAGQYAKPRSQNVETCAELVLPVWRGDSINGLEFTLEARRNDPERMLLAYQAAAETISNIHRYKLKQPLLSRQIWTSHEALLLDYEMSQVRLNPYKKYYLASTHWPWVGIRTLTIDGPHVKLLSQIENPIACKIDASVTASMIKMFCEKLNPRRIIGRLTFISRFGSNNIHQLGALIDATLDTSIPTLWMCDPMHGNTKKNHLGNKIRFIKDMMEEISGFLYQVKERDACCAGIHLETTPQPFAECFGAGYSPSESELKNIVCDPLLNFTQTKVLLQHYWKEAQKY